MSTKSLKTHYSAKELLELSLSCLPNSVQGIIYQAKKQGWESQKRVARGGGSEFALASLPKEIQNEVYSKFTESIVQRKPTFPTVKQIDLNNITTKQREIADARMALVAYVQNLEQVQSRDAAIKFICNSAKSGQLPDEVMALLQFILVIVACNSAADGGSWGWWVFLACLCGSSK